MSEDKTEILGDNEPTEELEQQKAPTTHPMLEAILARVNQIGEDLNGFRSETGTRLDAVERELQEQRKAIHSLERRFDVYTQDLLKIRGDVLKHEGRIEEIERKAS